MLLGLVDQEDRRCIETLRVQVGDQGDEPAQPVASLGELPVLAAVLADVEFEIGPGEAQLDRQPCLPPVLGEELAERPVGAVAQALDLAAALLTQRRRELCEVEAREAREVLQSAAGTLELG